MPRVGQQFSRMQAVDAMYINHRSPIKDGDHSSCKPGLDGIRHSSEALAFGETNVFGGRKVSPGYQA